MNGTSKYVLLGWKDGSTPAGEAIVLQSWGCGWIGGEGHYQEAFGGREKNSKTHLALINVRRKNIHSQGATRQKTNSSDCGDGN